MQNIFSDEGFCFHFGNLHCSIFSESDDVVQIRTVKNIFIFFERSSDESFGSVDVEFLVCYRYIGRIYVVKNTNFRTARLVFSIFFLDVLEIIDGIIHQVFQIMFHLLHSVLQCSDVFQRFISVIARNSHERKFCQSGNVLRNYLTHKIFDKWF